MQSTLTDFSYDALDRGLIPDFVLRRAIRYLSNQRLVEIAQTSMEAQTEHKWQYIEELKQSAVAIETAKANEQHYEVSTPFIQSCLGKNLKYSCCLYPTGRETLDEAEDIMLESYTVKARLVDGMDILDLGCGWGSLSLFLAKKYPNSRISSLSNSATQKVFIDSQAVARGLTNLEVFTGDVKVYDFAGKKSFDRIMSIEMFEHMKNYEALLAKISTWLKPNAEAKTGEALLFVHIFAHKTTPYHFEEEADGSMSWMTKHFFSGGTMPSFDLFTHFQKNLTLEKSWWVNGKHYGRTSEDWLKRQDSGTKTWIGTDREAELVTGEGTLEERRAEGRKSFYRWRTFYLTVAVFFAMHDGEAWGVGHYLFKKRD